MEVSVFGSYEEAIQVFKMMVARDGILREVKNRQAYMSRTQRRRLKDLEALRRRKRMMAKLRAREERYKGWRRK